MKSNYVDVSIDQLIEFLQKAKAAHPDRVFVTGVTLKGSFHSPTKKRKHYAAKMEHAFAEDVFTDRGVAGLANGGGFYIAHIPREFINPKLLKDETK